MPIWICFSRTVSLLSLILFFSLILDNQHYDRLSSTESISVAQSIFKLIKSITYSYFTSARAPCNCFLFLFGFHCHIRSLFCFIHFSSSAISYVLIFCLLMYYNCVHLRLSRMAKFFVIFVFYLIFAWSSMLFCVARS